MGYDHKIYKIFHNICRFLLYKYVEFCYNKPVRSDIMRNHPQKYLSEVIL